MQSTVYVSNLSYSTTESDIQNYFSPHGEIKSVKVLTDKTTGRPRGIAFVEYVEERSAGSAISATDRREFMGRTLSVSLARPKGPRADQPRLEPRLSQEPRQYQEPRYQNQEPRYQDQEPRYPQPSYEDLSWGSSSDTGWDKNSRRERRENRRKFDR